MDKQKQIEEMDEIALKNTMSYTCAKQIAMNFYNAGYRKINEGVVVLAGTAKEEHFVDLLTEFDEMGFYPLTTCANAEEYTKDWKRRMLYAIGQLRKETAEEFAEKARLKTIMVAKPLNGFVIGNDIEEAIFLSDIDEICKEITEGE